MTSSDEPRSLRSLFEAAESKREALESSSATSPTYHSTLDAAISLYSQALQQIAALSVFSPNEGVEDIATTSLPFLLVDFYIAELVQRTPGRSPAERVPLLHRARASYERFLAVLEGYGLVRGPYATLLERYRDDADAFAVVASTDPARRRDGKIAAFKAEKQLKDRLDVLRRSPRYLDHGDEEVVRELHLAHVAFALHTTFHALDSLNRELPLLALAPTDPSAVTTIDRDADETSRLDRPFAGLRNPGGPLLSQKGQPLQPFTLVGTRTERARGVFRPGHNLPTMSIDEYLAEEERRGGIIKGGVEPKTVVDEDDVEAVDRAMYKAREWDEFTDNNPRGSGNTLNMG